MSFLTTAAVLERVIEPGECGLNEEASRFVLGMKFPQADYQRMNELAEKARQGTLTTSEEAELNIFISVGHVLSTWKSKARHALSKSGNGLHP